MKAAGKTYNVGSEHRWADWQVTPVLCPACGKRVTLKQSFFASYELGTYHAACAPYAPAKP